MSDPLTISVVVGNPKPRSRTWEAAHRIAEGLGSPATSSIDVIDLGPGLLGWGDPRVAEAVAAVKGSDIAIFASPTFKATYSGLLKLFLDQFETGIGLEGVVAVPLMLGAGPGHQLASELHLKPVLTELGAIAPAPALYLLDSAPPQQSGEADWLRRWSPIIRANVNA